MKRVVIVLVVSLLILSYTTATATAGITGHFISEADDTFIIVLSEPINDRLGGVYLGSGDYLFSLGRDEDNEDSIRILSSIDESDVIVDLQLRYENDDKQAVLVSGDIARFNGEGTLISDQSILAMQDVRFIRQEDMLVSKLQGTRWVRYTMTISGSVTVHILLMVQLLNSLIQTRTQGRYQITNLELTPSPMRCLRII